MDLDKQRTRVHGKSPNEMAELYTKWAENNKYDQELKPGILNAPTIMADEVAECFPENREKLRIIDIACGTGRVGERLYVHGFKNFDGLDPSEGMLKQCKNKGVYKILYNEFCGDNTLPIDDGVYDCLAVSGGFGAGHIPCTGLKEMTRIVKPGGLILIVMRKEYDDKDGDDINQMDEYIAKLEDENKVEIVERREVAKYTFDRNGILFKLRVKGAMIKK